MKKQNLLAIIIVVFAMLMSMTAITASAAELSVSKSHTDIASIAGVKAGQNTGVISNKAIALDDVITLICAKGKSTSDPCIYTESIRLYQNGATLTVKAKEGYTIEKVTITLASKSGGQGPISVVGGTASALTNRVYTITADEDVNEIVVTTTGTDKNNRLYVSNIAVDYNSSGCQHNYVDCVCTLCGLSNHSFNEGAITTAPECGVVGVKTYTCTACGETTTEDVEALQHIPVDGVCSLCGEDITLTIEEAIALGSSKAHNTYTFEKYCVTGEITEVYNTTFGNMKIKDANGNILTVYGTYSADGSTRYDKLTTKPVKGDIVTVFGVIGQYSGTAQVKDGWIVEHTIPHVHSYFYPCDKVCQECFEVSNPDAAHNVQHVDAVEATCTENGNVEYWYCSDCGSAWLDEAQTMVTNRMSIVLPTTDHVYFYPCDPVCMNCFEITNPDAAHNVQHVDAVEATCTENGNVEYWCCSDCGSA